MSQVYPSRATQYNVSSGGRYVSSLFPLVSTPAPSSQATQSTVCTGAACPRPGLTTSYQRPYQPQQRYPYQPQQELAQQLYPPQQPAQSYYPQTQLTQHYESKYEAAQPEHLYSQQQLAHQPYESKYAAAQAEYFYAQQLAQQHQEQLNLQRAIEESKREAEEAERAALLAPPVVPQRRLKTPSPMTYVPTSFTGYDLPQQYQSQTQPQTPQQYQSLAQQYRSQAQPQVPQQYQSQAQQYQSQAQPRIRPGYRPSPAQSSADTPIGERMEGQDGRMYIVAANKNGTHYWKPITIAFA